MHFKLSGCCWWESNYLCFCYLNSWKVKVLVTQSCPILCNPMDCSPPGSTVHGILQARILERVAIIFSRGSSQPRSPALQVDSSPAEPQGEPKNTEVGSHSLLQGIFTTQGLNPGLLHCRQFLYQLSYQLKQACILRINLTLFLRIFASLFMGDTDL